MQGTYQVIDGDKADEPTIKLTSDPGSELRLGGSRTTRAKIVIRMGGGVPVFFYAETERKVPQVGQMICMICSHYSS